MKNYLTPWFVLIVSIILPPMTQAKETTKILIVSAMHSAHAKVKLLNQLGEQKNIHFTHQPARLLDKDKKALFSQYSLVIFDSMGARDGKKTFSPFVPVIKQTDTLFLAINWLKNQELRKGIDKKEAKLLHNYYSNGGSINLSNMIDFLNTKIFTTDNLTIVPPAIIYAQQGLYHPDYEKRLFTTLAEYLKWQKNTNKHELKDKPVIGIAMYQNYFSEGNTKVVDALIKKLEANGAFPVPFYYESRGSKEGYEDLLTKNGQVIIHNMINLRSIHLAQKRKEEFTQLGAPVIQALSYYSGDQAKWEADKQGISSSMTPFTLVLPEASGVIDPTIVAVSDPENKENTVIDYQMDALVERSLKQAQLRLKPNVDKKITVMVWNYPSGEKNIGASFLNVPRSLNQISTALKAKGYAISSQSEDYFIANITRILRPFYRGYELDELLKDDLAELMPLSVYQDWYKTLPETARTSIEARWGKPKDNFMVVEREGQHWFVMPRIKIGNMIIMRQPPRSDEADKEKGAYHNKTVPVNHYYLASYQYARDYFSTDAFIHLGTHGSQEYLPGKERGLSIYDAGDLSVGNTPVIYPFIVDDVGEAMQTKRRGRAVVLSHMTPPFAAAGLHSDSAEMHNLMHQYKAMDKGAVKQQTAQQLSKLCFTGNYCKDIGWTREAVDKDFAGFMVALHDYLGDLAAQNQPLGLHTFGKLANKTYLNTTIIQMLGTDFRNRAAVYEHEHYQENIAHEDRGVSNTNLDISHTEKLEDLLGFKLLNDFVINNKDGQSIADSELREDIKRAKDYYQRMQGIVEMENLAATLEGRYIPVANGGDPIRSPEALPTGTNLYGFDPSKVPTQAAWETGKKAVNDLITDYYQKHGRYPDKMAFSLWSIETMRHYGVLEAQVLYAMGIKPVWDISGRVIDTEIIPFKELKRPRVDVVLSATGLYRDAFPNVIQWIAEAITKIAQLKEKNNPLYQHSQALKSELLESGIEKEEAEYLSTVRIFSNESGNYGTGLGGAVMKSNTWERDGKLADLYTDRMGYYYGSDDSRWGKKMANVDLYAKTLSGTDIALFSRSSNLYGVLTSDDPFQYLGGISLAIRRLDGASPELYISNLRDPKKVKTEDIAKFLSKELRTRAHHPRWVREMQKEGYAGALNMLDNLNNFWGWQVVDPTSVREDQWQEFFEVYVQDKYQLDMDKWFAESNNHTQAQMIERMLEAVRKDYWAAGDEVTKELVEKYIQLATQYDVTTDNEKLTEYVNSQAQGFGLSPLPIEISQPMVAGQVVNASQQIQGQKLEEVKPNQEAEKNDEVEWILYLMMLFFMLGVGYQAKEKSHALCCFTSY
ncbi:MAG: cobaltochelatase subunit CobN [Methylococcales bacterium]|nr:cobaltochelatase subunit CobN [Methylococcales bacterium]